MITHCPYCKTPLPRGTASIAPRLLRILQIQAAVADYYSLQRIDMISDCSRRASARPRQIAIYLCHLLTARSLPEIGRMFHRDHTTVLHAIKKITELSAIDAGIARDLVALRGALEGANA